MWTIIDQYSEMQSDSARYYVKTPIVWYIDSTQPGVIYQLLSRNRPVIATKPTSYRHEIDQLLPRTDQLSPRNRPVIATK